MAIEPRPDRRLPLDTDLTATVRGLSPAKRRRFVGSLAVEDGDAYDQAWGEWAHDGQLAPDGDWSTWILMAGRGFGKTLAGAHWLTGLIAAQELAKGEPLHIALVGASLDDARRVMVEGRSGLLTVAERLVSEWNPSRRQLSFAGGSQATLFSGCSPDLLRGPEHHLAWCDELAKWEKAQESWDNLRFGLRLGAQPRALVTTTPRPGPLLRDLMATPGVRTTRGRTAANPHLSRAWQAEIEATYAGTRLGRQELDGELLPEAGALWTPELIERCRDGAAIGFRFARVLIAVDPPAGDGTCGIIAVARDGEGETAVAHVLADHSVTARSPEGWAGAVADAAAAHGTVEVLAEGNQGGTMVKAVLHTAAPYLQVRTVHASKSKSLRAEPIAHLFEAGRVRLCGRMPELEAQLLGLIAGGGYEGPGRSPDRADAMVWGVGEVMRVVGVRVRGV